MARAALVIAIASVLSACSLFVPSQTPGPGLDRALYLENRGGPAFVVRIANADVRNVDCNGGGAIRPGEGEVPQLPWELTVIRVRDGSTVFARRVERLPQWFVQIGNEVLGMSEQPVFGPPGPTCPPSG